MSREDIREAVKCTPNDGVDDGDAPHESVLLTHDNAELVAEWSNSVLNYHPAGENVTAITLEVPTSRGVMFARPGDYIVKVGPDRFVSYSSAEFASLYFWFNG